MAVTVLSGTSGALYYKPAGTTGSFPETGVDAGTDTITIQAYLNLKPGDPVKFRVIDSQTGAAANFTIAERVKDLFDRAKFSSIIFDAASGPAQVTPAAPQPYYQTQLTATFEAYLD